MKYSYAIYLSNISILLFLYQTEVPFEHLMIEARISDVLSAQRNLIQNIRTSCSHAVLSSSWFRNLTNYIIGKDTAFGSQKDLQNDTCTTQKKWERSPLLIVMFLLNFLGFILSFGRHFVDI